MSTRWQTWLLYSLIWLAGGMLLTTQLYLTVLPRGLGVTLQEVAVGQFARVALWLLLCPAVIQLLRWLPLEGARRWRNLGVHAVAGVAAMLLNYAFRMVVGEIYHGRAFVDFGQRLLLEFNGRALADVAIYWAIVAVVTGLGLLRRQHELELTRAALQAQLAESELRALKQQLQPHFLFNTLNSVTMLVRQKQEERAVDTIAALSALLRRLIDSGRQQEVSFASELDFTQRYLEIEQTRFGDRLQVSYDVTKEALNAAVPSLLLQPFVENAVKHGISRRTTPGRIRISANVQHGRIRIEVRNDNADTATPGAVGTNLGLETTRQRLGRIYGHRFELSCAFHDPEGARVTVALPFREAGPSDRKASHEPDQNTHR